MIDIQQLTVETLKELIALRQIKVLRELFDELNLIDLTELVEQLDFEEILFLFKTLKKDVTASVFTYLPYEVKQQIIQTFTGGEITKMLDNLYSDDIVDFLEEMPANVVKHVLQAASPTQRAEINLLLSYPENAAGSLMSTDFVELEANDTVLKAITKIKRQGKDAETISVCYVINDQRQLVGTVRLRTILFAEDQQLISELMDIDFIAVYTHDDQEQVARTISKYDLTVIPVVNDEERLIGIITIDDIIDVFEEEVTEDIQKMAAIIPMEGSYLKAKSVQMTKNRIVWLLILMVSATFTGSIIDSYQDQLVLIPALAYFIPMIMSTAGNAGAQASTMVIRGISIDQLGVKDYWSVILKETQVAIYSGLVLFVVNVLRLLIFMPQTSWTVDMVVSLTLFLTVVVSKFVGGLLPLVAELFHQDPAAMAAPLITTIVDAVALIIYFSLAMTFLNIL